MTFQTKTAHDPWRCHEKFVTRAGVIRAAAESLERGWRADSCERLDAAYAFLTKEFIPDACAEEQRHLALSYRDYVWIEHDRSLKPLTRLTEQLAEQIAPSSANMNIARVRGVLFEIAALVDLRFAACRGARVRTLRRENATRAPQRHKRPTARRRRDAPERRAKDMTLAPWPFQRDFLSLREAMNQLMEQSAMLPDSGDGSFSVVLRETPEAYVLTASIPVALSDLIAAAKGHDMEVEKAACQF